MKATHSIHPAKAAIICMGTLGFSSLSICAENSTRGDAEKCVKSANLEPGRSTEPLPKGVCPIRVNFGPNSYSCFDRRYRLEASNTCEVAVQIHIDGGSGNYESATGDYTLYTGNEPRRFSCLEALGHCNGIRLTVLGFKGNASPVASTNNGKGLSEVFFVREGTRRPNQYGGTDLYYQKEGHWYVARTNTKPQVPDYVANEAVKFYSDPKGGFYVVGSSGEKWWIGVDAKQTRPNQ
jgi:hypothetical protein